MKNFHTKLPDLLGAGLQVLIYAGPVPLEAPFKCLRVRGLGFRGLGFKV